MKQFENLTWNKLQNKCMSFQLGDEPEVMHIIKTGFKDKYMIISEDAFNITTGEVSFGTKANIEQKYNIKL